MIITFESRKNSFPVYYLLLVYCLVALLFKDRFQYLLGSVLALVMFLGCYGIGKRICFSFLRITDQSLFFPLGLGILLIASYVTGTFTLDRTALYIIWGALVAFAAFEVPVLTYRLSRSSLWGVPLILLAFWSALTPPIFSDALKFEAGLGDQFLVTGKIQALPGYLFSSFPPFGPVMQTLYAGLNNISGARAFSLLIFFQIVSVLIALLKWLITEPVFASEDVSNGNHQTELLYLSKSELMLIPLLYFPAAYVLIHFGTSDLLASLFFCCAIAYLMKEFEVLSVRKLFHISLLLAFSLWTKFSYVAYVFLLPVAWFAINRWRWTRGFWKEIGVVWGSVLLLYLPLLIRNGLVFGDPVYPALSGIVTNAHWTPAQSVAFVRDFMPATQGFMNLLAAPLILTFQPSSFGPASQIGIVFLVSLCVYPFARKLSTVNRALMYCAICYVAWLFLFADFRNLLPIFLLTLLISYFAFRYIFVKAPRYLRIVWIAGAVSCFLYLLPVYQRYPLIRPDQSQKDYLRKHLDYFPIAETVNQNSGKEKIYMLGEDRIAHLKKPLVVSSVYDQDPVLKDLKYIQTPEQLYSGLRSQGIRFVIFNQEKFFHKHSEKGSAPIDPSRRALVQELLDSYGTIRNQSGDIALYELGDK